MLDQYEQKRLEALHHTAMLDSESEQPFDYLVDLARYFFNVPIALVSLIDENRQWFKACVGLEGVTQTARDVSFCTHAIKHSDDVYVVLNAKKDPLFKHNPLVTAAPHIRFYAGAPITSEDGYKLGTLCLIDSKPRRKFSDDDKKHLKKMATLASLFIRQRSADPQISEIEECVLSLASA